MKHTKTPWKVNSVSERDFAATITDENGGVLIAKTAGLDTLQDYQNCEQENENARRIVAAVNACEGYTTKDLEFLTPLRETVGKWVSLCRKQKRAMRQLQAQNARILNVLREILSAKDVDLPDKDVVFGVLYAIEKARAAIAEAENQPETQRTWVCNECNFPNFTGAVSADEIERELHSCIKCGGVEFHIEQKKTP